MWPYKIERLSFMGIREEGAPNFQAHGDIFSSHQSHTNKFLLCISQIEHYVCLPDRITKLVDYIEEILPQKTQI